MKGTPSDPMPSESPKRRSSRLLHRRCGLSRALNRAKRHIRREATEGIHPLPDPLPESMGYPSTDEPCWAFRVPSMAKGSPLMLRPSRLLLISKHTGRILYDGSAHDEG